MAPETVPSCTAAQEMTAGAAPERGDTILTLCGEVDMAAAPDLWERVEGVLLGGERVVVDLGDVVALDSCGLSVFVRAHRRLSRSGGALVLRSPNVDVRRVLDLTGLDQVLTIES